VRLKAGIICKCKTQGMRSIGRFGLERQGPRLEVARSRVNRE
jgi:hypothetical protein